MNAVETEARIQRLLSGDVGEPVPGSDFDIVLDALRNARIDVGTLQHLLDAATDELARVNADFDLTASAAARVVVERDALRARLDAIADAHREPVGASALRAEMLDDARPGHTLIDVYRDGRMLALDLAPHVAVADVATNVDRAIAEMGRRESVASALRAFDVVTRTGIGTGSGVLDALRTAAVREGLPSAATLPTPDLIAACRAHVARVAPTSAIVGVVAAPDAGRSEASDGFGLGSVGGAACAS